MHPNKSDKWRRKRYWGILNLDREDNWVFGDKSTGTHLIKFKWNNIERHILVKGKSSPDDPSLKEYWEEREKAKAKNHIPSYQKIADRQKYKCPLCGDPLFNGEDIQKHHKIPRNQGGKDTYSNLILVHYVCHKQFHSNNPGQL